MKLRLSNCPPYLPLIVALIFVVTIIRATSVHYFSIDRSIPSDEALSVAVALATQHQFADPFGVPIVLPTGPSAHVAPAFPLLAGGVMTLLGTDDVSTYVLKGVALAVFAAWAAVLPFVAAVYGFPWQAGLLGALGLLVYDPFPDYRWDVEYTSLLIMTVSIAILHLLRQPLLTLRPAVATGVLMGVLLLFSPAPLLAIAVLIVLVTIHHRKQFLSLPIGAFLLIPVLLISPWLIRNWLVFGKFVPIRDNLGLELQVSNNNCARPTMSGNFVSGCFAIHHPNANPAEIERVRELGEVEYNAVKMREAIAWIRAEPDRFRSLTLRRVIGYWFPYGFDSPWNELTQPGRRVTHFTIYAITLLSIPGLVLAWRRAPTSVLVLAVWLVIFPLPYYVIQQSERYRRPILWVSVVTAGLTIQWFWMRLRSHIR
jgi:hypothetical protein